MAIYLKKFENHTQYDNYINGSGAILPNVSICTTEGDVHYNPLRCDETSVYEIIGTPSYPSTIDGDVTSFDITVNYKRTDTDTACTETVTEGTDTVTVECGTNPSTSSTRTVSGTAVYYGNEIEYSVTQSKFEAKITAKVSVTSTTAPTSILYKTSGFSSIEIDGVEQPSVVSAYTFNTLGEHIIKYTLKSAIKIGKMAFGWCYNITSVIIPNGVIYFDVQSFVGCSGLTSIDIPDSVTSIGQHAFNACSGLTSVTIGSGVTSIGSNAFRDCRSLTSINIPSGVTSINLQTFENCSSLTSIEIPNGVTSIGSTAFAGCSSLTSIDIPNSVTSIGQYAFSNCTSLTNCMIGSGLTSISGGAFQYCSGLTSIVSNATTAPTIQSSTFYNVKTGGTLTVPAGSTSYDVWMGTGDYYLGKYNWTKVEQ